MCTRINLHFLKLNLILNRITALHIKKKKVIDFVEEIGLRCVLSSHITLVLLSFAPDASISSLLLENQASHFISRTAPCPLQE